MVEADDGDEFMSRKDRAVSSCAVIEGIEPENGEARGERGKPMLMGMCPVCSSGCVDGEICCSPTSP